MSAKKFWFGAVLMVSLGALVLTPLAVQADEPIKIGSVLRLSAGAEDGIPAKRGVELAVDEINKSGGINGRKLGRLFSRMKKIPRPAPSTPYRS